MQADRPFPRRWLANLIWERLENRISFILAVSDFPRRRGLPKSSSSASNFSRKGYNRLPKTGGRRREELDEGEGDDEDEDDEDDDEEDQYYDDDEDDDSYSDDDEDDSWGECEASQVRSNSGVFFGMPAAVPKERQAYLRYCASTK